MSERSVAEIIGWATYDGMYEVAPGVLRTTEPTVDDLLAWLRGQGASEVEPGCGDAIEMYWDPEHPDMCSVCIGIGQWDAPTLLAALELTVRAMAGES